MPKLFCFETGSCQYLNQSFAEMGNVLDVFQNLEGQVVLWHKTRLHRFYACMLQQLLAASRHKI